MDTLFTRRVRFMRSLALLLLVPLACLELGACSSPISPAPVVQSGSSLPAGLTGLWHGVSARLVSDSPGAFWARDDMLLRADGSAELTEYEGPRRRFVGTWLLNLDKVIVIDVVGGLCRRTGTVDGNTMSLTCSNGSITWSLVFAKQ